MKPAKRSKCLVETDQWFHVQAILSDNSESHLELAVGQRLPCVKPFFLVWSYKLWPLGWWLPKFADTELCICNDNDKFVDYSHSHIPSSLKLCGTKERWLLSFKHLELVESSECTIMTCIIRLIVGPSMTATLVTLDPQTVQHQGVWFFTIHHNIWACWSFLSTSRSGKKRY